MTVCAVSVLGEACVDTDSQGRGIMGHRGQHVGVTLYVEGGGVEGAPEGPPVRELLEREWAWEAAWATHFAVSDGGRVAA